MLKGFAFAVVAAALLFAPKLFAEVFPDNTSYTLCFTPDQDCTSNIVNLINSAKTTIFVQAYSFSSWKIARALAKAVKRGVVVKALFDRSLFSDKYSKLTRYLQRAGVQTWLDNAENIAHNKVMIFDAKTVETGSFNYTYSAQHYNAENVLIIHSPELAAAYLKNWQHRVRTASAR